MSDDTKPEIRSIDELAAFIKDQTERQHDYNTSAEALHDITLAAFDLAARLLGNSGFQASYAALKLLGSVNGYDGPYGIIKAENMLYPQYDPPEVKAREMADSWAEWVREQAAKKLAENERSDSGFLTSPRVIEHWQRLAT